MVLRSSSRLRSAQPLEDDAGAREMRSMRADGAQREKEARQASSSSGATTKRTSMVTRRCKRSPSRLRSAQPLEDDAGARDMRSMRADGAQREKSEPRASSSSEAKRTSRKASEGCVILERSEEDPRRHATFTTP